MNATLAKSILGKRHPLTRGLGAEKINRSVTLPLSADRVLDHIAAEFGMSVNEFARRALAHYAETVKSVNAPALRQAMAGAVCLLMTCFVWWQGIQPSHSDNQAFRGKVKTVRVCKVKGRRNELEA